MSFAILSWSVVLGPEELSPTRHTSLGIISGILCGLFGYFFTGSIRLVSEGRIPNWGKVGVQAGGGIALFLFVLIWWRSNHAPVANDFQERIDAMKGEVASVISYLQLQRELRDVRPFVVAVQPNLRNSGLIHTSSKAKDLASEIPDSATGYALALKAIAQEDYVFARELLNNIVERGKMGVSNWGSVFLARAYLELYAGQTSQAASYLDKARGFGISNTDDICDLAVGYYCVGRYLSAKELLEDALTLAKADEAENERRIKILEWLANTNLELGALPIAEEDCIKALALTKRVFGQVSERFVQVQDSLVSIYLAKADNRAAINLATSNVATLEELFTEEAPETLNAMRRLALCHLAVGDFNKSLEILDNVLSKFQRLNGEMSFDVASGYGNRGTAFLNLARFDEAEKSIRKAIMINEHLLGTNHPHLALEYGNLAVVLEARGSYDEGIKVQLRALNVEEKVFGTDSIQVSTSSNTLALLYESAGDLAMAERWHKRALRIRQKVLGDEHPMVGTSIVNLASILHSRGRFSLASERYRDALAIFRGASNANWRDIAATLNNLARALLPLERLGEAEEAAKESLVATLEHAGPNHKDTVSSKEILADIYMAQRRHQDAETLYRSILETWQGIRSTSLQDIAAVQEKLAYSLANQNLFQDAESMFKKSMEARMTFFGESNINTGGSFLNLGILYEQEGRDQEAREYFEKAFEVCRENGLDKHPVARQSLLGLQRLQRLPP